MELAASIQVFFTAAKIIALIIIIIGGFVMMGKGEFYDLPEGFRDSQTSGSVIALAFYDGLWAYDGWNNLNYAIEELKNPYRNLPLAILIGIPLVTVLYLLTNISYLAVMTKRELLASATVGGLWADRVLGVAAVIIPISVAMSTFGAANGSCFTSGRLAFAAAREGHLPQVLSYLHIRKKTPVVSLILSAVIAIFMIIPGEISSLIDFFSFTAWLFYGLAFLSLIVMRFTFKDKQRRFKVFIGIPIIMFLVSIYLVVAPIVQNPNLGFLYAFILIISGLVFYFPFVFFKLKLPCMEPFTRLIQKFLAVAPSKYVALDDTKSN